MFGKPNFNTLYTDSPPKKWNLLFDLFKVYIII